MGSTTRAGVVRSCSSPTTSLGCRSTGTTIINLISRQRRTPPGTCCWFQAASTPRQTQPHTTMASSRRLYSQRPAKRCPNPSQTSKIQGTRHTSPLQTFGVAKNVWQHKTVWRGRGGGGGAEHGGGDGAAGFLSLPAMYIYTRALLEEQELRCAINGVPLGLGPCEPEDKWRQASLDAISPRKGHVQGNLRWICWGFNNTNNDKKKKDIRNMRCAAKEGAPTAWTKELWESYAGIRH